MQDLRQSDLESVCKELLSEFQGILSWKWDSRLETVLAEFGVDAKDSIRAILERYLGITWDSSTIDNAPDIVQMINGNLGGLMSGQLLFTSDPDRDAFVFCAWCHGATERPSLFASRHPIRHHTIQGKPNRSKCLEAGSGFKGLGDDAN